MPQFTVFDETGRPRQVTEADMLDPIVTLQGLPAGWTAVPGAFDESHYLLDGMPVARQAMPLTVPTTRDIAADGQEEFIISGVPVGASVAINGSVTGSIDDGELVFTTDDDGDFEIKLELFPWLVYEVTVHAH